MSFTLIYHPECICSEETRLQRKQTPLTCLRQQSSNLITKDPLLHSHLDSEGDSLWTRVATAMWQRQCSRWSSRSEDRSPERSINSGRFLERNDLLQNRYLCVSLVAYPKPSGLLKLWMDQVRIFHLSWTLSSLWQFSPCMTLVILPRQTGSLSMMMVVKSVHDYDN